MTLRDNPELFWLTATALITALFWVPYILNRMVEKGLWGALRNPEPDERPRARWADRMMCAHRNAVENLVVFAPLVLTVVILERTNEITAIAALTYFAARSAHFVIYSAGVPLLRTVAFLAGFGAQVALALVALGVL